MPPAPCARPGLPRRYGRLLGRAALVALAIAWLQAAAVGCPTGARMQARPVWHAAATRQGTEH